MLLNAIWSVVVSQRVRCIGRTDLGAQSNYMNFWLLNVTLLIGRNCSWAVVLQWALSPFSIWILKLELPPVCSVILENILYSFKFRTGCSYTFIFHTVYLRYFYWSSFFCLFSHSSGVLWHLILAFPVHSCLESKELYVYCHFKKSNLCV